MVFRRLARSKLFWALAAVVAALGLFLAFAVFGVQTLFYDSEVNEDFPVSAGQATADDSSRRDGAGEGEADQASGGVQEGQGGPVLVSSGQFHAVAHEGTGDALVYRMEDGSYVLRLENLNIFNGPALYVYAVAAPDANDAGTVLDAGFVDAGPLKGNTGNQTYELPEDFDPEVHRSVSVWCERFSVNFATAPLS